MGQLYRMNVNPVFAIRSAWHTRTDGKTQEKIIQFTIAYIEALVGRTLSGTPHMRVRREIERILDLGLEKGWTADDFVKYTHACVAGVYTW